MKSCFLSCFGFICLFFSKCAAFSSETTNDFISYLSVRETKLLSIQDFPFIEIAKQSSIISQIVNDKFVFLSSYAPGRDALYQGGGALAYYLTSHVYIKTGPSYSRDIGIGRKWKWAMQLSYEIPFAN